MGKRKRGLRQSTMWIATNDLPTTSAQIGSCFVIGCPGGESPSEIGMRADRMVKRVRAVQGNVLLFSSGHFLRVFAARWLGQDAAFGRYFLLSTTSLSALGYEHNLSEPVIRLWDDTRHVGS